MNKPENLKRLAFTLIELLVTISIMAILAAMLLPSLAKAKATAQKIACVNHLRQLNQSAHMYADDAKGQYPLRSLPTWITTLHPYYNTPRVLRCPSDGQSATVTITSPTGAPRSYLINGWNDYFQATLDASGWDQYRNYKWPEGMRDSAVNHPSDTIIFGEKKSTSSHVHMDFFQGSGNDIQEVEQRRHSRGANGIGGGSNFAFVDGSVRFLREGKSLSPLNLWAVTEVGRTNSAMQ